MVHGTTTEDTVRRPGARSQIHRQKQATQSGEGNPGTVSHPGGSAQNRPQYRSPRFETLGWKQSNPQEGIAFFQAGGVALYPREGLANDALMPSEGNGFAGFTLAYNAQSEAEVDEIISDLRSKRSIELQLWRNYSTIIYFNLLISFSKQSKRDSVCASNEAHCLGADCCKTRNVRQQYGTLNSDQLASRNSRNTPSVRRPPASSLMRS